MNQYNLIKNCNFRFTCNCKNNIKEILCSLYPVFFNGNISQNNTIYYQNHDMDIDKITNFIQIFPVLHVLICIFMFVYVFSSIYFIIFEDSLMTTIVKVLNSSITTKILLLPFRVTPTFSFS